MNQTTRRKRSNKKSLKTRKHRGGINWKFWEKTAPANAPPAPAPPAPAAEVVENKCPPCPVCAQAQAQQAQAMQEPAMQEPAMQEPAMQEPAMQANEGSMMMSGGKRRRGRKCSRKNRKSKKWFQMGCKSMF